MKNILYGFLIVFLFINCKKKGTVVTPAAVDITKVLSKGINLSNWFNDYSDKGQYGNRFTSAQFAIIKQAGFTNVRLPIGHTILFQPSNPSQLNAVNIAYVDAAVKAIIDAELTVTINYHPLNDDYEKLMAIDAAKADALAAYWKAMATYFKKYPADKLVFEVYNEPHIASYNSGVPVTKNWWVPVQEKLIKAIREVTTENYIIAGGEGWNNIEGLKLLGPYNYPRIVYNFHYYEPFVFTHQGATWVGDPWPLLHDVPYPSSPENVVALVSGSTSQSVKDLLNWYGGYRYNVDTLYKQLKAAADWGKQYNVPLICNEFGSYKPFAPRQSRLNLIRDVRTSLEQLKIGWAMWECDEGFGFIDYPTVNRNNPVADNEVLMALGLK
ncbi:MAG: cellulase family glycosylhydrolase [Sphingobacteriales bacterium]|nr:cellulase family glycosylhydrolase [Sphingobacteriales bacterium]